MIPRILEYEDKIVKITPEAYAIPELKEIIDKYDNPEPYLSYIHAMSDINSQYINIPEEDRQEAILGDLQDSMGDFDWEDPLVDNAIKKYRFLSTSPMVAMAQELNEELHRIRKLLRDTPLTIGEGGNFRDRVALMKDIDKIATAYSKVKSQAEKESGAATKGNHEKGLY